MKKQIVLTLILVAAAALVTWLYFKNLNPPGKSAANIMQTIPHDAALVFELNNDNSFYDIYDSSAVFTSLAGTEQLHELNVLHQELLANPEIKPYTENESIYISVHSQGDLLLTLQTTTDFNLNLLKGALQHHNPHVQVTAFTRQNVKGFTIQLPQLQQPFELLDRGHHIYSGSFSASLITAVIHEEDKKQAAFFKPLSDQQQSNALANLYVNYNALSPLFDHWFRTKNTDFLKPLRLLPAKTALTLNYKTDALMFNGYTELDYNLPASYVTLFKNQRPYHNQLKNIFPSITALSTCFSVSDPLLFQKDLLLWQQKGKLNAERQTLFNQIRHETGVTVDKEFVNQLGNEFALLTTRFNETLAIIQLKDGSKLQPVFDNISTMNDDNTGKLNYAKLPFFLLGDAFSTFRQPYFTILDNYLILASSATALKNYIEIYNAQNFLTKSERYNEFDDLLAEQCNIASSIYFKNASYLLKRGLRPSAYKTLYPADEKITTYYAGSYQLSSTAQQFYTNFCMQLNRPDTLKLK